MIMVELGEAIYERVPDLSSSLPQQCHPRTQRRVSRIPPGRTLDGSGSEYNHGLAPVLYGQSMVMEMIGNEIYVNLILPDLPAHVGGGAHGKGRLSAKYAMLSWKERRKVKDGDSL